MIFKGDHSVIKAIQEKKLLMDAGKPHEHIRPLLLQGGGLMRGSYGTGAALALEERGYTNAFSYLVGVSSGAPIAAYFAAGTSGRALEVLRNDCLNSGLINAWRFWNQVDTKSIIKILREHETRKIDMVKAFENPAELFFGAAEYKTALPKLLHSTDEDSFFTSLHASINMQNVSPYRVFVDGVHYADGGFSNPHVIDLAIKELKPTHALIVTNNDLDFRQIAFVERLLNRTLFRLRLNGILTQAINARRETRDAAIAEAIAGETPTAVVWGDGSIGGVEQNADKIAATVEASRTWWHGLLSLEEKDKQ